MGIVEYEEKKEKSLSHIYFFFFSLSNFLDRSPSFSGAFQVIKNSVISVQKSLLSYIKCRSLNVVKVFSDFSELS